MECQSRFGLQKRGDYLQVAVCQSVKAIMSFFFKKNITTVLWIRKKVYFCKLFEVECKGEWEAGLRIA